MRKQPHRWTLAAPLALALTAACGEDAPAAPQPEPTGGAAPTICAPGEREIDDGSCVPAGIQDDGCPAGERGLPDGSCVPAGIPADGCGEGFEPDGADGCQAILPEAPCAEGQMAVPGDADCHEVAPCGTGSWGDIPTEATTQHVDGAYAEGDSDGSQAKPWTTILEAIAATDSGAIVAIAAGSYLEDVTLQGQPVRLWGRCPALVEVVGSELAGAAITLGAGADGSEVRGLAIRGQAGGIAIEGTLGIVLDRLWIHHTAGWGVAARGGGLGSTLTLSDSLVEATSERGVYLEGVEASIERTQIRHTQAAAGGTTGRGLNIRDDTTTGAPSIVTVRSSLVEASLEVGVLLHASEAVVEDSVVRDTAPSTTGTFGRGLVEQSEPQSGQRSQLELRRSIIERSVDGGLVIAGSDATIEAMVIADTAPSTASSRGYGVAIQLSPGTNDLANVTLASSVIQRNHGTGVLVGASNADLESCVIRDSLAVDGLRGRGLSAQYDPSTGQRASVSLRYTVIERSLEAGVVVQGSDAWIEGTVVRDTESAPASAPNYGRGITTQVGETPGVRSGLTLLASLIDNNREVGVFTEACDALLLGTLVRGTRPRVDDYLGYGVAAQVSSAPNESAALTLRSSVVEGGHGVGVMVLGASGTVESSVVRAVAPEVVDDLFGDGLVAFGIGAGADLVVRDSLVADNGRAGLACFGARLAIRSTRVECNPIDLNSEPFEGEPGLLEDQGANTCGCGDDQHACKAMSADLAPPSPVGQ